MRIHLDEINLRLFGEDYEKVTELKVRRCSKIDASLEVTYNGKKKLLLISRRQFEDLKDKLKKLKLWR